MLQSITTGTADTWSAIPLSCTPPDRLFSVPALHQAQDRLFVNLDRMKETCWRINQSRSYIPPKGHRKKEF